jgi:hypothetical protein
LPEVTPRHRPTPAPFTALNQKLGGRAKVSLYVPTGELTRDGIVRRTLDRAVRQVLGNRFSLADDRWWLIIEGDNGDVIGRIEGGSGPHNTIVSLDGTRLYMGGRFHEYLNRA